MNTFQELQLPEPLRRALEAMAFSKPTPVQAAAIPRALALKDLIATAQTGTGKTAAFSIPLATTLMNEHGALGLVLAPTRELALQIERVWLDLTQFAPALSVACLIGGESFQKQRKQISKRPRLIVATPGRLIDHLQQRTIELSRVRALVLDEADRMLDMGFAPQLNQILKVLPQKRQTLLFSATWDASLDGLAKKYLYQPERISVGSVSRAAPLVEQTALRTTAAKKNEMILDQINKTDGSILIFARTQHRTDRLARYLDSYGVDVGRIHGGRSQSQRNSALAAFRDGEIRVLVATDIAARGIDVTEIAQVINYDLPRAAEDYVHRIGRTGRAGATGRALSLLTPEERSEWSAITKLLAKTGSPPPKVLS